MARAHLTRRAALALLAGATVAACSPGGDSDGATATPDPDAAIREQVAEQEWSLVALYDAVIAAQPALADDLGALRQQHVDHANALGSASPPASSASPSAVPNAPEVARATLIEAEAAAVRERTQACQATVGAEPARLLALIAASEAGHAAYLRGAAT